MPTLLVFLKYPQAGAVKTRLSAEVGSDQAAALYREWISIVFSRIQSVRKSTQVVGYFGGAARDDFAPWHAFADEWWPQPDGDLGFRLNAGFGAGHARGGNVIAIGTDCLEVDASLIKQAHDLLSQYDVVFGPALDGGYYLVGTSRHLAGFFEGVPWSCSETLAHHTGICRQRRLSLGLLPMRRDIDTLRDWMEHQRVLGGDAET